MGLFGRNFNKTGPGVNKDEPRKKGVARHFGLWTREFGDLCKLNLLFSACLLPSLAVFVLSLFGFYSIITFLLSLALAFPVGGALTACVYYITKMMRDDPSYVWYEFKRKFKENYRQAAPAGILCASFVYAQILLWGSMMMEETPGDLFWVIIGLISLLLFGMLTPYIFLHFAYIDLRTPGILKNSVFLGFGKLPRSIMGSLMGGLMWIVFALYFPMSMIAIPFILIFGITTSMLLCLMWVWKPFDQTFKIEETLIEKAKEKEDL